ncbi:uncharacterized protein LOC103184813 isoform X3 [Callorhinchus milii]|uniref:uncharacterized protein LOC103184813 isoform X3 n=1 Tax=Callorhinchus milii TaxID=7868 RepID=UPI001C3FAF45|nr:uncharacterized protein LOC103184813 isoform X3 [Callorhinchus milii]XP_042191462.1 uncharacterized protein LOC103184813 isoform X3 [Callorhinchus milii]
MDVAPPEDDGLHDMEVEPPDISLPEDRAGEDLGEYSGGTSLLNYSVIKTSQYSGIKPSEYSGVKPSEYSGTTGSKHSGITESKYSRIKSPEFSGITGSKYSGGTFPSKYSGIKAPEYSGSASKRSVVSGVGNQRNTQRNIRTPNVYAPGNSFVKHGASVRGWEQTPEKDSSRLSPKTKREDEIGGSSESQDCALQNESDYSNSSEENNNSDADERAGGDAPIHYRTRSRTSSDQIPAYKDVGILTRRPVRSAQERGYAAKTSSVTPAPGPSLQCCLVLECLQRKPPKREPAEAL